MDAKSATRARIGSTPAETEDNTTGAPALPPPVVVVLSLLLLGIGLGSSIYLGSLWLKVHRPGGGPVESFCALSENFNCVTVATSEYSSLFGLPIALYGIEFFAAGLLVMALSVFRLWPVRRWDSLVLLACICGLPFIGWLAYVSATRIHSFCIMCCTVYAAVVLLVVVLGGLSARLTPGSALLSGPRELWALAQRPAGAVGLSVVAVLAISQLAWVPRLLTVQPREALTSYKGLATDGLSIGPANAPIRIQEFTDYQCPYCGKAHRVMMDILQRFPGKIRLTHRDFPLDNACNPKIPRPFHPQACQAAYFARCAATQGKYWPFEALVFPNRAFLSEQDLLRFGEKVGLNTKQLAICAKSPATKQAIRKDIQEAIERGIQGTPTYFIEGVKEPVVGLKPPAFWEKKITELLRNPEAR